MASFPDLRPGSRSAKAESKAVRTWRSPRLLAVSTALLLTAFFAVSELATLRGAKAHDASAYLTRELGSPLSSASLVRAPARTSPALGGKLEIRRGGLKVTSGRDTLVLRFKGSAPWQQFANGVARPTRFGREAITFGVNRVEQSLLVDRHLGTRVWEWKLAANVDARIAQDGSVRFGASPLRILPVAILDRAGRDVTPARLRWSLRKRALVLRLDDVKLPTPYIIDPVALVGTCNATTAPSDLAGCSVHTLQTKSDFTSSPLARPSSVSTGDLMLAQITVHNNDAITAPSGWTAIGNKRTSGANLEQALYYRIATSADTPTSTYSWSWTNAGDASGAIYAYSGVDSSNPFDVTPTDNAGSGTTATATGVTTTQNGDMLVAFYGATNNVTITQTSGEGLTQEHTVLTAGGNRLRTTGADGTQSSAGASGNKTAGVSGNQSWVAHLAALTPALSPDGSGTMTASIGNVSASQTGRTITFTYTAASGGMLNGSITLAVPSGWSAPSTTASNAGYTTASTGTVAVAGSTITVSNVTVAGGATMTITYGSTTGGGPGAAATSSTGAQTWTVQEKSKSSGTLTNIASSPSITVNAADGSGTMGASISSVSAGQTGRTITFTYTAPTGGLANGAVAVAIPSGWSAPSTTASAAGYSTASAGTLSVVGSTITVSSLTLAAGNTFTITYGDTGSGGPGATATSSTGAQTWTVQEKSTANGSVANIASSPSITVYAADGSGTMGASISVVSASQTGRTITFTYTAPTGGISTGSVTVAVPSGWSPPSTTGSAAGFSTSSAGTLTVSGSTITVSSLTLAAGNTFTITYGSTASGGPGATATSSTGAQTWTTQEKSTSNGSLTNISSSPSITVYAADGSGTLTADTSSVPVGSTGNTITFTYTAPAGGISNGSVTVAVPSGWSPPSTTGSAAGYSTSSAGTLTVPGGTITVSSLTLAAGNTVTITYGSKASGGAGATATSSAGAQTWQAQEKSTFAGSLTNLSSSPSVTVLSSDGSGTLTTPTSSVNTSSTGNTITFTYTASTGGLANGSVTLAVPSGWSPPSITGSAAGYTAASTGTVGVSSQTITISGITLAGGSTFTITYGSTAGGGAGATAPATAAAQQWQAQEKSSSGGTLTNLASSPAITVNDPTAPSAPSLSFGSFTNASVTGSTVYVRQGSAGGFTATGTSSDPESGIDLLTFPSGLGAGWSGGGQDNSSPYAGVYTFSSAATAPAGNQDVTATNGWALTSTATSFTVVADTTAPSVTAPSVTAGYYTTLSVPVTKNGGSDGGSGVDITTSILERDDATLTNGSCGSFSGSWSTVTLTGGNDTNVLSGHCYEYREKLADNVGNQGTSAVSNVAKVDTSAPSTPSLALGGLSANAYWDGSGTLYIRPAAGGTFTVTASSSDAQSGLAGYTFGTLNSNGGANFGGSQSGDHFDYTFDGSTTAPSTARTVNATNGAGAGSANATYSIAADTTAPSVTAPSVTAGYYTTLSVPVTKNGGSDGGSGTDNTSSILERDDATLANGTCGGFSGSWTTVTLTGGNDTGVLNGHCYEYREKLSDHVGNQGTSGTSNVAKVDSQGPANTITLSSVSPAGAALKVGTRIYYRGSVTGGGSFKLTNAVTDGESAPASSATAALGGTTSGWSHTTSTVSTPAGGPYDSNSFSWSQGTSSSPTEVVTAADGAGNTTAASTLTFTNDSSAPTGGALTVNGGAAYSTSGSFAIDTRTDYTETQSATESGLASSTLTRAAASLTDDSCGTYGSPTTIVGTPAQTLSTGCYLYTLTGTDNLGNTASVTATVKVDTSDPSAPTLSFSNFTGTTSAVGNTVFFLPTSSGSFDVTATSSDADSGIAGYTFPSAASFGAGWSASGSGSTRTYSYTPGSATPGSQNVTATNNAGRTNSASFDVEVSDATPPTTSIQCNGAACQGSYYTSSPVSVTLSADDGPTGSGVNVIRYTIDGSDPTPVNGSDYLGAFDIFTTTTVKFRAYDNLGNEEAVGSQLIRVDGTPPTLSLALAEQPASGAQHVSGTTLYYRPGASGGTFRVTATAGDPQTGIVSVDFPSVTNVSGGGSQTTAPYREDYSWGSTTSDSGSHNVVATNGAGATTSLGFTLTPDSNAPSGQSITLTGAGAPYYGSPSVTFSLGNGSDGGAGLDASSATVTRETGTLSGNSCSGFTADAGTFSSPDNSVSGGHCYRYTFTIADNVGNLSTPVTATAKVDTQAPSISVDAPTALSGAAAQSYDPGSKTLFFRSTATGSFRLNSSSSDAHTAVTSVAYPDLSAVGGWSTSGTDSTWSSGASSPGARSITATDSAGNTASDTITITDDLAAPTGQTITLTGPQAPYSNNASVSFSLTDGSDGSGSGIDTSSRTVTRETGDLSGGACSNFTPDGGTFSSPDTSVGGGHCYRYTFTIADRVGNVSSGVTATAKVDTDAPNVAVTAPVEVTGAGNQSYDGASHTQWFRPSGSGSFTLTGTASDNESGVAQLAFPDVSATGGWSGSTGGADTAAPYASPNDYSWTSGASTPGPVSITATNGAAIDGSAALTIAGDSTAPTGQSLTLTGPDAPYYGSASVGFTLGDGSDGQSGLDTSSSAVTRETGTLSGDTCSGFAPDAGTFTSPDTSVSGGHCYRYSFTIADRVGNVSTAVTAVAKVDTQAPTISADTPTELTGAGNQYYDSPSKTVYFRSTGSGSFRLESTSSDAHTAVRSVTYPDLSGVGGWSTSGAVETWSTGATAPGARTITATDKASNAGTDSITIADDTNAPTGQTITLGSTYSNGAPVTFTLGNGSDGGAGLDLSSATVTRETGTLTGDSCSGFTTDAGTFTSPDASVTGGHCYRYTFTIADRVGNVSTVVSATAKVDTDNPSVTLTDPGTPLAGVVSLGANASDSATAVQTIVFERAPAGGSTWTTIGTDSSAPYTASWNTGAVSDGLYDLRAVATDTVGNTAIDTIASRRVDNTAPDTTIDSGPADPSNDATPTFAFSSSETGSTFQCRVDGGGWAACASPHTTAALAEGSHTFQVRATDAAGNTDASPASSTWTVDLTAPDTTLDSGPSTPSGNATPSFTFSSSETSSTFECSVDGGSWATCTSPHTTSSLSDGSHTFDVRATDQAGNTDATPASQTWTVDLTAPNTTIGSTPPSPSNDTTPTFTFSSSESGSTFECRVDGSSWAACTSPHTTAVLAEGSHTFQVRATDVAGNTDASPASFTWSIDLTAPGTTADSGPADPSNDTTPTFAFSATEPGSTFECRVEGGGWAPCTSPHTTAALTEGSHTFEVRATDAAGNTDASPASSTWTIDLTAPDTTIDSTPPALDNNATPSFTFHSSETGSTFECRVDSGSWAPCTSPHTTAALDDGSHTFDVRATDAAGNTDGTPASHTWSIDLGPPTVTITAPTTYVNASDPSSYTVTASTPDGDVAHVDFYECSNASVDCATGTWTQFDTDNSAPFAGSWSTPGTDGKRALRAVAVDAALNTGEDVRTVTIDRTAPSGVTVSYPDGYVTGSFSITTNSGPDSDVDASSAALERQTGNLANDACSSYGGWTSATGPDSVASGHCAQYRYRIADNAGNWTTATSGNQVKSDTAAPTSAQDDPGANLRQTVTLSSSASDTGGSGLASVAFERRPAGGGSWTTIATDTSNPYSTSFDTTGVADGLYDFRTVATDVAGNAEASPSVVANRRIDNTAPSATMQSPGNPVRGTVSLTSNTSDGGSGLATVTYELAPHSGSFNTQPASWDTTLGADGLYDLRVVATDVAGNSTTSPLVTTRVDNTPPALTFSSPASGDTVSGTVSLTATSSDASPASPPISFFYKLHSDPPSAYTATGASWNTSSLPAGDGLYDLRARATDDASNTTTVENMSIRVDNVPPSVTITAPAAAINGSLPSPTSFSATAGDPGGSGVQQVQFFECSNQSTDCASGIWSPLGTVPAPGPYTVSWNIPATDGNHALAAVATDNAGHASSDIRNVDIDRTAPETTIVAKPADPSNTTTPSFTFGSSEAGSTFECRVDGGSWAPCTSPNSVSGLTDNAHTFDVRATDAAGNTDPSPDTWTWHRDTANPASTLNNPGANLRQTVTLTSAESDPLANGYASGLASVTYEYSSDGSTWATIGTLSSAPYDSLLWNTTGVADGVYQLRLVVHDVAGNSAASPAVTSVRIDNTVPTTSQDDPGQYLRATKTLTGSAADSGSGVDHVDFQRAPAGSGSWTTIATATTSPYSASFDTTSVPDGHYDLRTVAYDVAGNQAAATPVTSRLVDNTPPSATLNDPGAYLRGAVSLSSSTSDPGGADASGVASVAYEYSTNGGSTWLPTGSTFDSTSVADGNVDLHVVATDAAGNTTTSPTATKLVDNTKPNTTDDAPGGWHASPVTVNLTANDAGSGVNVTEYSVDGNPTYTVGTNVVIPAPADGSNDGSHTIAYFSVDNAGNIETVKSATVLIDATPPACPSCSAADYLRGTVTLGASPSPDGSGIKSVAFEYTVAGGSIWAPIGTDTTAPYTTDWDTSAVPDGHYDLRIVITDNADNVTTSDLPDKVVDNTSPNVATVGAPTEGQVVTGSVAISATASDATSPVASVEFVVRGTSLGTDTTAPFSLSWNTASGSDGAATIQIVVTDMAGNTTTSPVRNVTVDNLTPTPTLADPGQNLSGTVSLSASSDPDTTQVDFERRPSGGGSWVTIASDSSLPWGTPLDTTTLADGLYDFRAVATDGTGHTGTSPIRANIRVDNTAPSGSLTDPGAGATVGGTNVTLSASVADGGSGVASVAYELRPTGGGAFSQIASSSSAPFGATWDATTVATGSYDLRPVIADRAGNTFTGPVVTFNVDVTAPTVTLTSPGATIFGTVTLNATVSGSGATSVVFAATPAGGATWTSLGTDTAAPWNIAYDTAKLADGLYDLRATVTDNLGNSSQDVVSGVRVDNTAPQVVSSSPADGSSVGSATAISLVASEPATPVGVTLDGGATVAPVISGTHIDYNTGALAAGPHTLAGELQDPSGKRLPFRVHFTVGSTGYVEKNTSSSSSTTVTSGDGFGSATVPSGAWSTSSNDWLVVRITPTSAPSGLTNGFGPGPEALDVTAFWALSGTQVHEFAQPLEIVLRSTERGLVPATYDGSAWRVIHRVPTAGTLPAGWVDGFFTASDGVHVLTKHLSLFALLHDLQAPQAPQNVRGYVGPDGLTIRWLPGSDNSGTYDYITVFAGSSDTGHYGPDYTAATVAGWKPGDPRIFRLQETDLAGNQSELSAPLAQLPSLVGMTLDQAEAALAARGLSVGTVTVGGAGKPGTVTGPEGLALAPQGAEIDLTVAPGGAATSLVFKVVTAAKFKPAKRKTMAARVLVTRSARVSAQLISPRRVRLYTWHFKVRAGRTIVRLRIPRQVRRPGIYTLRWTARAGRESVTRTVRFRIVGKRPPVQKLEIVLAGTAAKGVNGSLGKQKATVVTSVDPTFDAAANRNRDVRVIVVDVDELGLATVHDLHVVFPSVKIVALAAGPKTMAAALKAGATMVLPRSTPPATLAKIIQRLATRV